MSQLIVLTSYPPKGKTHAAKTVGVASYTKLLLQGLKKTDPAQDITVWAEVLDKKINYSEPEAQVHRVWKRKSFASTLQLAWDIVRTKKTIVLSYEAYLFGSLLSGLPIFVALIVKKLLGSKNYILLHQVPKKISLSNNWLINHLLNWTKLVLFFLIQAGNTSVIVFEQQLATQFGYPKKTKVIPHLVPDTKILSKKKAKEKLGISQKNKVILYFGYLAPYKGIDELVQHWPKDTNYTLLVAGGINPNHTKKPQIVEYVSEVKRHAQEKGIAVTDFVHEKDIPLYFSAAEALVLPYTTFMSSSGPLALAIGYEKPILLSNTLQTYTKTADFNEALQDAALSETDCLFSLTTKDIKRVLHGLDKNKTKFSLFSKSLKQKRSLSEIAQKLMKALDE